MSRQPRLDTQPTRCTYADQPTRRPHCQLTAVVRYASTALCTDCQTRRSTLGKGHPPHRLPPARELDTIQWITDTEQRLRRTHTELTAAVRRARAQGHTWTTIGNALNITRQATQQRFSQTQRRQG